MDFFFFSFFFFVRTCVYALKNMVSYNHHGYLTLEYKNFFFLYKYFLKWVVEWN